MLGKYSTDKYGWKKISLASPTPCWDISSMPVLEQRGHWGCSLGYLLSCRSHYLWNQVQLKSGHKQFSLFETKGQRWLYIWKIGAIEGSHNYIFCIFNLLYLIFKKQFLHISQQEFPVCKLESARKLSPTQ